MMIINLIVYYIIPDPPQSSFGDYALSASASHSLFVLKIIKGSPSFHDQANKFLISYLAI